MALLFLDKGYEPQNANIAAFRDMGQFSKETLMGFNPIDNIFDPMRALSMAIPLNYNYSFILFTTCVFFLLYQWPNI